MTSSTWFQILATPVYLDMTEYVCLQTKIVAFEMVNVSITASLTSTCRQASRKEFRAVPVSPAIGCLRTHVRVMVRIVDNLP